MPIETFDIAIIGAGPAGMTAAIYAGRAKMKAILLAEAIPGGQAMLTEEIENYPGFAEPVNGPQLLNDMCAQMKKLEIECRETAVKSISKKEKEFTVETDSGEIASKTVILAMGANYKKLNVKGEEEFTGRGVSYCGVCDAPFFRNKEAALIGGGDTALYEANHLLKFVKKLHMVHRRDKLRATKIMQEKVLKNEKTTVHWDSIPEEITGSKTVEGLVLKNVKTEAKEKIACDGVFIFIGMAPNSLIAEGLARTDPNGYIITDDNMKTSCEGLYACGDVRSKALRQISTAVGEGAVAAFSAQKYIEE